MHSNTIQRGICTLRRGNRRDPKGGVGQFAPCTEAESYASRGVVGAPREGTPSTWTIWIVCCWHFSPEEFTEGSGCLTRCVGAGELRYVLTQLGEKMTDEEVDEFLKGVQIGAEGFSLEHASSDSYPATGT
ncbi:myosin regulatory light chain cdc4 [Scleroderma yunnanense]